jgi:acyl carrier protein
MATTQEKTELVETLKGPRFYRISITGYGGEAAYINISKEAHDFWHAHTEEHGDGDFVNYMINDDPEDYDFEELEIVPKEADFLTSYGEDDYKSNWFEAPTEFLHQMGVEYGSSYLTVEEVDSMEYMSKHVADVIDSEGLSELVDKIQEETDFEVEPADWGEELPDEGEYVCQLYSSEKGQFFDGIIETVGDFDVKKLKFMINEYPNGEDVIDGVEYDGEDVENNGGDTNGKGYSAHVWKNVQ